MQSFNAWGLMRLASMVCQQCPNVASIYVFLGKIIRITIFWF